MLMTFSLLTAASAVVDWWAVATGRRRVEIVAKPLTLALLIVVALVIDPLDDGARTLIAIGLVLSLLGDVFLLGDSSASFLAGLGSFLLGHVAYVAAFVALGLSAPGLPVGVALVLIGIATLGVRIARGVRSSEPAMTMPVVAYMAVISAMVVTASGTGLWLAATGAVLFYLSDAAIAWTRFISDHRHGRLFVIVTYHLGQALIVASIAA